jgi:hypothetical protein
METVKRIADLLRREGICDLETAKKIVSLALDLNLAENEIVDKFNQLFKRDTISSNDSDTQKES